MLETKLFLCLLEKKLKFGSGQKRNGYNIPDSILSNVDDEMSFRYVKRMSVLIFAVHITLFLPQARASLQNLLDHRRLCQLVCLFHRHSLNFFGNEMGICLMFPFLLFTMKGKCERAHGIVVGGIY